MCPLWEVGLNLRWVKAESPSWKERKRVCSSAGVQEVEALRDMHDNANSRRWKCKGTAEHHTHMHTHTNRWASANWESTHGSQSCEVVSSSTVWLRNIINTHMNTPSFCLGGVSPSWTNANVPICAYFMLDWSLFTLHACFALQKHATSLQVKPRKTNADVCKFYRKSCDYTMDGKRLEFNDSDFIINTANSSGSSDSLISSQIEGIKEYRWVCPHELPCPSLDITYSIYSMHQCCVT